MDNSVKNNVMDIVVDDNIRTYNVKNKQGIVLGQFHFNPTDMDIVNRFKTVQSNVDSIVGRLDENETDEEKALNKAFEVADSIKSEFDFLFGGNTSEAFFSKMNPLNLVNGTFFFEIVLDAVSKVIEKEFNIEIEKNKKKVAKYTDKYKPVYHN